MCQSNSAKIYSEKILTGVCDAVYFRLCIDLIILINQIQLRDMMAPITRGMPNDRLNERACVVSHDVFGSGQDDHSRQICYTNPLKGMSFH